MRNEDGAGSYDTPRYNSNNFLLAQDQFLLESDNKSRTEDISDLTIVQNRDTLFDFNSIFLKVLDMNIDYDEERNIEAASHILDSALSLINKIPNPSLRNSPHFVKLNKKLEGLTDLVRKDENEKIENQGNLKNIEQSSLKENFKYMFKQEATVDFFDSVENSPKPKLIDNLLDDDSKLELYLTRTKSLEEFLTTEIGKLSEIILSKKQQVQNIQPDIKKFKEELKKKYTEFLEKEKKLAEMKNEQSSNKLVAGRLEKDITHLEKEIQELKPKLESIREEKKTFEEKQNFLNRKLEKLNNEVKESEEVLEERRKVLGEKKEKLIEKWGRKLDVERESGELEVVMEELEEESLAKSQFD
jgi:chromosome segregation ATPase